MHVCPFGIALAFTNHDVNISNYLLEIDIFKNKSE